VTDYEAVLAWLELYRPRLADGQTIGNVHTFNAYRKEGERFLLWAVFQRGKALSSLDSIDCAEYLRFLEAPYPKERWIAQRKVPRWSADWRPFDGALSASSRKYAETVCKHLCRWLVGQRYLDSDPWAGIPRVTRATPVKRLRALTDRQLQHVNVWLAGLPVTPANERLRLLFLLALTSGLRKAELADARVGRLGLDGEGGWTLNVWGKGSKERVVPLLDIVVRQIAASLARRGFNVPVVEGEPEFGEVPGEAPVLAQLDDAMCALSPARLYELAKEGLSRCADSLDVVDKKDAATLRSASTHWLRHSFGRVWADRGGDIRALSQVLGHASPTTTAIYTRADEKLRRAELTRVFG
jgi:site-specific recombinase XerD